MRSPLDRPGMYENIDPDSYHRHYSVSQSKLSVFNVTPYHYYRQYVKPGAPSKAPSAAFQKGTLIHLAVLEPERFFETVVMGPCENKALKEWKDFAIAHGGLTVAKPSEFFMMGEIARQIRANPIAYEMIKGSKKEVSISWEDDETGLLCRGRLDAFNEAQLVIPDVKTTANASPEKFFRSVGDYRYHVQAAFYSDGVKKILGSKRDPVFSWIAIETTWPYVVQVYEVPEYMIEIGRAEYKTNLRRLAKCLETGVWPCYGDPIITAELPKYYKPKIDEISDDGSSEDDSPRDESDSHGSSEETETFGRGD